MTERKHVDWDLLKRFSWEGQTVERGEWQALRDDRPQMKVIEIYDTTIRLKVNGTEQMWAERTQPNLPWAEDHFQERVSGKPLNPGEQYQNWPWYKQGVEEHKQTGQFSRTYMERFWPKHAGEIDMDADWDEVRLGIRFKFGDLHDLVNLLKERPMTRQAYLPIWFPEDLTASREGERVPCSLGYHFMVTESSGMRFLNCTYYLRSCDFYRYLWDDIYMAGRLTQWVADKMALNIHPGQLVTHIANLHVFAPERERLRNDLLLAQQERLGSL